MFPFFRRTFCLIALQILAPEPSTAVHGIAPPPHMRHFEITQQRKRKERNINTLHHGERHKTSYRDPVETVDGDIMRRNPAEFSTLPV